MPVHGPENRIYGYSTMTCSSPDTPRDTRTGPDGNQYHWRILGQRGDPCTYCGIPADTMDHVPPVSRAIEVKDEETFALVPACAECNSSLGDRLILALSERRAYIRDRLRKRYAKLLNRPRWDDDELAELSPELADEIRRGEWLQAWVRARVRWVPPRI